MNSNNAGSNFSHLILAIEDLTSDMARDFGPDASDYTDSLDLASAALRRGDVFKAYAEMSSGPGARQEMGPYWAPRWVAIEDALCAIEVEPCKPSALMKLHDETVAVLKNWADGEPAKGVA